MSSILSGWVKRLGNTIPKGQLIVVEQPLTENCFDSNTSEVEHADRKCFRFGLFFAVFHEVVGFDALDDCPKMLVLSGFYCAQSQPRCQSFVSRTVHLFIFPWA